MRKIFYCIYICGLILFGCEKNENTIPECNVENPLEELDWLKEVKNSLTNCTCQISILQGNYREKTVFYIMNTDPVCNSVFHVVLWDCNGDVVKEYKPGQFDAYSKEVELIDNIYTCTD
jgi:hypothetical protein